jgi:signal transduction histidine kinase
LVEAQEELKTRLAKELNETIVADLLMLKKYIVGDDQSSTDQSIEIVDSLVSQLSDMCNDFAPANLYEKRLDVAVQELIERVCRRSGMYSQVDCSEELMSLPQPVHLHIYRMIQEWLNIVEKYARASKITVKIEQSEPNKLRIEVTDNGKGGGDPTHDPRVGGIKNLPSFQERINIISSYFDVQVEVAAKSGASSIQMLISAKSE